MGQKRRCDTIKKRISTTLKLLFLASLLTVLSGCYTQSIDDFYSLPKLPDEFVNLQKEIDGILKKGAEYSAPTSGTHRQAVQLEDLDGDGVDEAIAFFSKSGDVKPLKIYIFKNTDNHYEPVVTIEGEGTSIESIYYANMTDDKTLELIVGWQMGAGVSMLSAYSIRDYQLTQLLNTNYSEYTVSDLTRNGFDDLFVTRVTSLDGGGEAEIFTIGEKSEILSSKSRISSGVDHIMRIRSTPLLDNTPAVLVEGGITNTNIATDIFIYEDNMLKNITLSLPSAISEDTLRAYSTHPYSQDINHDGVIEVPYTIPLYSESETISYWLIDWRAYSPNGRYSIASCTYHNYSEGWYLSVPQDWKNKITVRRVDRISGERTIIFSLYDGDPENIRDFLAIYTLTGDNRYERSALSDRFTLLAEVDTIYSAEILMNPEDLPFSFSRNIILNNFELIQSEWITGEA